MDHFSGNWTSVKGKKDNNHYESLLCDHLVEFNVVGKHRLVCLSRKKRVFMAIYVTPSDLLPFVVLVT